MAEESKRQSFGQLVLARAWWSSWKFFRDARHDLTVGALAIVLTIYQQATQQHPLTMWDVAAGVVTFIMPFVIVWALLFLWHFWLAPAALAYEAARDVAKAGSPVATDVSPYAREVRPPPPDYQVWRLRGTYTVREFAALLDDADPFAGTITHRILGLQRLLIEHMEQGKLPYVRVARDNWINNQAQTLAPSEHTQMKRADALSWAEANKFPVSKLQ